MDGLGIFIGGTMTFGFTIRNQYISSMATIKAAVENKETLRKYQQTFFKSAVKGLKTCTHINFPEKRLKYYKLLKPGQNWKNLPEDIGKIAMGNSYKSGGGKTGFFRRIAWDKPSPTLVTHPAMPATDLAHPHSFRQGIRI